MDWVVVGIFGYVLAQLLVGAFVSRGIATEDDYLLAGRRLGYPLATFSIFATWFGAETCIGSAGRVHEEGLAGATHDPLGYAGCLLLVGVVFAAPLWRRQLTTLADLFRRRYSIGVERAAVLLMVPTSILWAAAQIHAFGQVLSASSSMGIAVAITLAAAVVIIYTTSGGLLADAVTDVVQGICLIVGLAVIASASIVDMGGLGAAWTAIPAGRLDLFALGERGVLEVIEDWAVPIMGSVVAQELIARVLASRSIPVARRSTFMAAGLYLVVGALPVSVGLMGGHLGVDVESSEQILPAVARLHLSTFAYVLFAGALVSAILSTVDSALLVSASLVSHNLIVPLYPGISEAKKVRIARGGVILFGIIAYVLALHADGVYALVADASSFGSAGLFVIMVFGLFTRLGGPGAAYLALTLGTVSWIVCNYILDGTIPFLVSLAAALVAYIAAAAPGAIARGAGSAPGTPIGAPAAVIVPTSPLPDPFAESRMVG